MPEGFSLPGFMFIQRPKAK